MVESFQEFLIHYVMKKEIYEGKNKDDSQLTI